MLEDNFRQSLLMSRGSWSIFFSSPICWFFWLLIVVFVFVLVRRGLSIKLTN